QLSWELVLALPSVLVWASRSILAWKRLLVSASGSATAIRFRSSLSLRQASFRALRLRLMVSVLPAWAVTMVRSPILQPRDLQGLTKRCSPGLTRLEPPDSSE